MMSKEKRRVPKLRFPGFTEDWEQRKLDDIAKIKTGGGTPKTANPEYWSGNIPWIQSSDLVEGDIVHVNINKFINNNALKNSAAKLISRDSIALVTRVGVGKVAVINQDFTTSQDFLSLSDFDGNDIKFLAYQLYRLMQENAKVLQGTSIKGITKTELIEQSISIPSSGQEQNLISNVLSKIDSIITLHQRKLDNLKLKKKALLQKLFPKNGDRYPELRFPGFTDAWEQRKLSDVLIERNEQQVETREYPLMSFVQGLGVTPKGERYDRSFLVLDQSKKYKRTELGDFIYSSNNLETGSIGINKTGKAVISPVYSIFQGVSIGDSQFIGIMSLLPRFIAKMIRFRQGVVYGQWRIHETDFLDISVLIPSVDERTKITQLILSIEELITLHQRKLDHLQLQKKALLQQIFV